MAEVGRKLLIVEDDPGIQSQLRWCFEGYEVLVEDLLASTSVLTTGDGFPKGYYNCTSNADSRILS